MARWPPAKLSFYEVYELFAQVLIDLYRGEGDVALARLERRWPARAIRRITYFHIWPLYLRGCAAVRAALARGGDAGVSPRRGQFGGARARVGVRLSGGDLGLDRRRQLLVVRAPAGEVISLEVASSSAR